MNNELHKQYFSSIITINSISQFNFLRYKSCPRIALNRAPAFSTSQPSPDYDHFTCQLYFLLLRRLFIICEHDVSVMFCLSFLFLTKTKKKLNKNQLSELINRLEKPWNNENDEAQNRVAVMSYQYEIHYACLRQRLFQ